MNNIISIHSDALKLEPLSIPDGFEIVINDFFSVLNEGQGIIFEDDPNVYPYFFYKSTLLFLRNNYRKISVDLGWYPEHDPNGEFGITVLRTPENRDQAFDNWEQPLYEFSSRNKDEIVDKLNELMADVSAGKIK